MDPAREATAAQIRMDSGVSTLADECGEQGRDWREQMEQAAQENALADELGLPRPHVPNARIAAADIAAQARIVASGVTSDQDDEAEADA